MLKCQSFSDIKFTNLPNKTKKHTKNCIYNLWAGTPPEINICEHSALYHPQQQVKALSCKEETICEHDPGTSLPPLG